MNEHEQDLADLMTGGLDSQVSGLHRASLDLGSVQRRATSIRRRRRGVAVGVVALVAAVVVPLTLSLGSGQGHSQDHSQGIDPAGDPTAAVDPAPPLPYLQDDEVVLGDGRTVATGYPSDAVQQLAVLRDGRVVLAVSAQGGDDQGVVVVAPGDGEALRYPVGTSLSLRSSADRSLVAWIDDADRPQVLESGVAEPVALAALTFDRDRTTPQVVGVAGSGCADGGCRVWAVTGTATNVVADAGGVQDVAVPAGVTLTDVSAPTGEVELMVGDEESLGGEQVGCAVLLDADGSERARTCDTAFLRFSPDGSMLEGGAYENESISRVAVLDTDLQTVATIEPSGDSVVAGVAWEDDGTLLAVERAPVGNRVSWSVVRHSVDGPGSPEVVAGPVRGPEFPPVFRVPG